MGSEMCIRDRRTIICCSPRTLQAPLPDLLNSESGASAAALDHSELRAGAKDGLNAQAGLGVAHEAAGKAQALFKLAHAFREFEVRNLERSFTGHGQLCAEPGLHDLQRGCRHLAEPLPGRFCAIFQLNQALWGEQVIGVAVRISQITHVFQCASTGAGWK